MNSKQVDSLDAGGGYNQSSKFGDQLASGHATASAQGPERSSLQDQTDEVWGDCHIFDYQEFKNDSPADRPGSEKDAQRLEHIFKQLNFNVYPIHVDLTKSETLDVLEKASAKVHPPQSKYFICCFLTHGGEGESLCMFDKSLDIDVILKQFSRTSCPSLSGKPKIFIIQACRGTECEEGVIVLPSNESTDGDSTDISFNKSDPDYLDFLVANSTYEGTYSFKTNEVLKHGSFFIDELCRSLEQFVDKLDLLEILTIVNYRMAIFFESCTRDSKTNKKKQMPCITSGLRTEIKFNKTIKPFVSSDTRYFETRKEHRWGSQSTGDPTSDRKLYRIRGPKNIAFLSILNTGGNLKSELLKSTNKLWRVVAPKNCLRTEIKKESKDELVKSLKQFAGGKFSDIDCLICFVASPAKGKYLYTVDNKKFTSRSVVENFIRKNDLNGKPKIFIFLMFPHIKNSWLPCVLAESTDGIAKSETIPEHADILEVAITLREPKQLEGVMKKITDIFENCSEDLLKALTRINSELAKDHGFYLDDNQDTFTLKSTLTKTLNCQDFSV